MAFLSCRHAAIALSGLCLLTGLEQSFGQEAPDAPAATKPDPAADVFGLTRIWKIHIRVSAENWKAMQPARGGFPGFGGPPPGAPRPDSPNPGDRKPGDAPQGPNANPPGTNPAGDRNPPGSPRGPGAPNGPGGGAFRPGSFGFDFEWVKADVELGDEPFKDVGLRFKGNGTYMMSASGRKRPLKLDFNRFVDGQKFHGLQQLNLHNNVMDPTHVRQALSYAVFQSAGVASPRTAFAEVTLTIDGECDREPLGLYTLVEEVDKAFLRRHFQTDKGLLLKPEGTMGLEYKGEDWAAYAWFEPKSKPKKSESQRLIDLTRLIHQEDDEQFRREIGSLLDTDQFARFLAANTLLANMDSFLTQVHNYYLYLPPQQNRFVFLPWDMDLSMGAFFFAGTAEQLQDLSIIHPHVGENKVIERLLAWDEFDRTYRQHLRELTESCFGDDGLTTKSLPIVKAAVKDLIDQEAKRATARGPGGFGPGPGPGPGTFGGQPPLEAFIAKRRESIAAQLAGKSKGKIPGMSFGPPGGGPGRPSGGPRGGGGFGPGNFHAPQFLAVADTDKDEKLSRSEFLDLAAKWLRDWDKDKNSSLDETELKSGLNEALGPPANAPGGFKPPEGFGPGNFLTSPLLKNADASKDGKVSKGEWTTHFTAWFKQWDKNMDERLDREELTAGLNAAFGPPPGQGFPGIGPRTSDKKPGE